VYVGALLSQAYSASWAGALVIVGIALLLGLALSACVAQATGRPAREPSYLPAILILALCNAYAHAPESLLGLALGLAASAAQGRVALMGRPMGLLGFALIGPAVYYLAGGAVVVYALVCLITSLSRREGWLPSVAMVLATALMPWLIGCALLRETLLSAYTALLPLPANVPDLAACLVLAALWVGAVLSVTEAPVRVWLLSRRVPREAAAHDSRRSGLAGALPLLHLAAPFLLAAVVVSQTDDPIGKAPLEANHLVVEGRWDEVLALGKTLPEPYPYVVTASVNRALLETGLMPEALFEYPQTPEGLLLCLPVGNNVAGAIYSLRKTLFTTTGGLELELGLPSDAETEAVEALPARGEHPLLLRQLASLHLAKGRHEAARLALRRLSQHPGYADDAREGLRRIERDLAGDTDSETALVRYRTPADDPEDLYIAAAHRTPREPDPNGPWATDPLVQPSFYTLTYVPLRIRFRALLETDPGNRQAFELEMALYLVYRQLKDFAERFPLVSGMGYEKLPRHFQEAAVVGEELTDEPIETGGLSIDPAVRRAYGRFMAFASPWLESGRKAQAREALAAEFGTTFWYYYYLEG